jgi:TonB family protein
VVTGLSVLFTTITTAGQESVERRVKNKVAPSYPELARKMNLAGVVKLEITVAPNGTVKDTKVIGGNPILVNAAIDAVKKWRFESGSEDSSQLVEFKFDPSLN